MKQFHAAVNHVSATSSNILCRLKELGNNSPSIRIPAKLFGTVLPAKHEAFTVEMDGLAQVGEFLIPTGNCRIMSREINAENAVPFDVDAYLASLTEEDGPF